MGGAAALAGLQQSLDLGALEVARAQRGGRADRADPDPAPAVGLQLELERAGRWARCPVPPECGGPSRAPRRRRGRVLGRGDADARRLVGEPAGGEEAGGLAAPRRHQGTHEGGDADGVVTGAPATGGLPLGGLAQLGETAVWWRSRMVAMGLAEGRPAADARPEAVDSRRQRRRPVDHISAADGYRGRPIPRPNPSRGAWRSGAGCHDRVLDASDVDGMVVVTASPPRPSAGIVWPPMGEPFLAASGETLLPIDSRGRRFRHAG